ncbi:MAG TPA: DUF1801 domain-containing protein [Sediminibacterium sp.]|nr:DUF1801 domain-containing protein [Sediminibacterium sp.]
MKSGMKTAENIDSYIALFPSNVQKSLKHLRKLIKKLVPTATEAIKYGMPTFVLQGNLVHFAAYQHHIGFYPAPDVITHFENQLKPFQTSKGAIQFPINEPLPYELIEQMVIYRLKIHQQKLDLKDLAKKSKK